MDFIQFVMWAFLIVIVCISLGVVFIKLLFQSNNQNDYEEYDLHEQELRELFKSRVK